MTIFGWDMSHFDAPSIGSARAEGIQFVTHKAGGDKDDAELAAWWSGVRGIPDVLLGAYWVLYPGSPEGRADAFIARLDSQCPGWRDRPFILQVDCEKWNGDPTTVPPLRDIQVFCRRLVARMTQLRPIVYAPKWVYGDSLVGLGFPLWASSYVSSSGGFKALYPGDSSSRWGAYSGQTPAILQYADKATIGGQTTCDANAYKGTLAQLTALVAPGWSENMDLTSENLKDIAEAAANAVWRDYRITNAYSKTPMAPESLLAYAPSATGIAGYVDDKLAPRFTGLASTLAAFISAETADDQTKQQALTALADSISALTPAIIAGVIAALPSGTDPVSQQEVTTAVETAIERAVRAAFPTA